MFDDFYGEDLLNPMAILQRRLAPPPQIVQQDPNERIPPATEEQEKSWLPRISGAALGGLGYVGSVLGKTFGGRAVRGALGGNLRELLTPLPFSDTLGITDETQEVHGRDLLRKWGMADQENTWGNFLGGLGVDLATDPGMYLTTPFFGGALTKAGDVAKKIGQLPKGLRNQLGGNLNTILSSNPMLQHQAEIAAGGAQQLQSLLQEPLTGLAGLKLPFSEFFGVKASPVLAGQAGLDVLNSARDAGQGLASAHRTMASLPGGLGFLYKYATPPGQIGEALPYVSKGADWMGRHLKGLFHAPVMGATSKAGQASGELGYQSILPYAAKYRERLAGYGDELKALGATDADSLRMAIEGVKAHPIPKVNTIADAIRNDYYEMLREAQRLGLNIDEFADPLDAALRYGRRQWSTVVGNQGNLGLEGGTAAALSARDASLQSHRLAKYSGFEEGTVGINKMFQDPAIYGDQASRKLRAQYIRDNYLRDPSLIAQEQIAMGSQVPHATLTKEIQLAQKKQSRILAFQAEKMPVEFEQAASGQLLDKAGQPIKLTAFGHNPIDELMGYTDRFARMRGQALGAHDLIANNALIAGAGATMPRDAISAHDALKQAGLTLNTPQTSIAGAHQTLLDSLNAKLASQGQAPLQDLKGVFLAPEMAKEVNRIMGSYKSPEVTHPFIKAFDHLTHMFKSYVTAPWPGFNIRNYLSGQAQNIAKGATGTVQDSLNAYRMGAGGVWEGLENIPAIREALVAAGKPVTAEEATKQLARWQFAYNIGGHSPNIAREMTTAAGETIKMPRQLDDVLNLVTGQDPKTVSRAVNTWLGRAGEGNWHPKTFFAEPEKLAPVAGGRISGDIIENMNRSPLFVQRLREGFSPEQAAREVLKSHYDYTKNALTSTEKTIMRRMVPFYSYTRQNIPQIVEQLASNPGGLAGTLARLSLASRQEGGFIPKYLGEGLAIPLTEENDQGMKRYLTRLDLPADQAFEFFKGTTGDPIQSSIMGLVGQMNPLIKGPIEYGVDKQFFSGRELGDLYTLTGNKLLDQALFNSPIARLMTTARTLSDPRKWDAYALPLNLLTGAKVTDVDMPKYKAIAEREFIKKRLQGLPETGKFETIYVKPGMARQLSPEEYQLVQLQKLLEKRAREMKKENK